jgi:hypothetical protein
VSSAGISATASSSLFVFFVCLICLRQLSHAKREFYLTVKITKYGPFERKRSPSIIQWAREKIPNGMIMPPFTKSHNNQLRIDLVFRQRNPALAFFP